jgi:hypothetical protein
MQKRSPLEGDMTLPADELQELVRKALASLGPKATEEWNDWERRQQGFVGYGRGSRCDQYHRALKHLRHAASRLRDAGPEFADLADVVDLILESVPLFQKK